MDNIAFIQNKSSSDKKGQSYNNSSSPKGKLEEWTIEYIADRLFFEMLEIKDDAQGWEDYQHKAQRNIAEHLMPLKWLLVGHLQFLS